MPDDNTPFDDDKIISLSESKKRKEEQERQKAIKNKKQEPLINIAPFTKYLSAVLIGLTLLTNLVLPIALVEWTYFHLGFIPARFTGYAAFEALAILTPFTSLFLHGSWLHLSMNLLMLIAFGSGIERFLGGKKMMALFVTTGLFGCLLHFLLNWDSIAPVIGASGGISGLFAAAIILLHKQGAMGALPAGGRFGLWPIVLLWIGISILLGSINTPVTGNATIAWAAHVGGFVGGFIILKLMKIH